MISFSQITPRLFTGGGPIAVGDVGKLQTAGITHVIDCADLLDDDRDLSIVGIGFLNNPTADDGQSKPPEWFRTSLYFAWAALAGSPRNRVYAHCQAGINRGPSTLYAILRSMAWSPMMAKTKIFTARPEVVSGLRYADDADEAVKVLGYE